MGKTIGQITSSASTLAAADLFEVEQGGTSKKSALLLLADVLAPWDINLWAAMDPKVVSGTWTRNAAAAFNGAYYQSDTATGAAIQWEKVLLPAGSWRMGVFYVQKSSFGVFDVMEDATVRIAATDSYRATQKLDSVIVSSPFSVAATKLATIKVIQNGTRNGSSTGDALGISAVTLHRIS